MDAREGLREDVTDVLECLWSVDTSRVRVQATDPGVVILQGRVSTPAQRRALEAAARRVVGASAVVSDVAVDDGPDSFTAEARNQAEASRRPRA